MRLITITAVLALALALAGSPVQAAGPLSVGMAGGYNISTMWGNDAGDAGTRNGFGAGLILSRAVSENVNFRSEIWYTEKGTASTIIFGDGSVVDVTGKLTYIEVPLLFDVELTTTGNVIPKLFLGPAVGVTLGATVEGGGLSVDVYNKKTMDFGVVFGGGLSFGSGNSNFFVETRYTLGLTKVFDDLGPGDVIPDNEIALVWPDTGEGLDYRNANLSFVAGIMF
jgi:hypothetical protein